MNNWMNKNFVYCDQPINREAWKSVSKPEYRDDVTVDYERSNDRPVPYMPDENMNEDDLALIGTRYGETFTVLYKIDSKFHGKMKFAKNKNKTVRVSHMCLRCDCGMFTIRKTAAIKTNRSPSDRCTRCERIRKVKYLYEVNKKEMMKPATAH